MPRSRTALLQLLNEQVELIKANCDAFDAGNELVALELATRMRVLFHDTRASISLMQQLGDKYNIQYIDSALPIDPQQTSDGMMTVQGMPGLWAITFRLTGNTGAVYVAPLSIREGARGLVSFDVWWTEECLPGHNSHRYSRKWLVTKMTNTAGGAHVDPIVNQAYEDLTTSNLGMTAGVNGQNTGFINSPALVGMRQIAWEALESLKGYLDAAVV